MAKEIEKIGFLDILINNTGIFSESDFKETDDETWMNLGQKQKKNHKK